MCRSIVPLALTFWIVAVCPTVCFGHTYADGHDSGTACPSGHDSSCDVRPCLCATSTAADASAARGCVIAPFELCMLATSRFAQQIGTLNAFAPEIAGPTRPADALPMLDSISLLI